MLGEIPRFYHLTLVLNFLPLLYTCIAHKLTPLWLTLKPQSSSSPLWLNSTCPLSSLEHSKVCCSGVSASFYIGIEITYTPGNTWLPYIRTKIVLKFWMHLSIFAKHALKFWCKDWFAPNLLMKACIFPFRAGTRYLIITFHCQTCFSLHQRE